MMDLVFEFSRIPLDEQNPERKEKPDEEEDGQNDRHRNAKAPRKVLEDMLNHPFHPCSQSPLRIRGSQALALGPGPYGVFSPPRRFLSLSLTFRI
jgi:hypothetical protein